MWNNLGIREQSKHTHEAPVDLQLMWSDGKAALSNYNKPEISKEDMADSLYVLKLSMTESDERENEQNKRIG